ncbi:MAG TPA: phosphotyrosine protein phosphatase [Kiritimatiellia bacterium]|nr:phosphotyrosine protein phosphatase [Kiritimatiellia bacterium]
MNTPINILFVCGRNNRRSPTAEKIFTGDRRMNVRSGGIADTSRKRVTDADMKWANLVLAMERKHAKRLQVMFRHIQDLPPIEFLDISDEYTFMSKDLIDALKEAVDRALEEYAEAQASEE